MVVPWSGFPLKALIDLAPAAGQREIISRCRPSRTRKVAPGQRQIWYPWPYTEGLAMFEAVNELSFMVTGPLRQAGAEAERRAAAPRRAVEIRLQAHQVDRALPLFGQAAGQFLGEAAGPGNTASGPTSIPKSRIRAGARRASATSAPASASPPSPGTAMANMSPRCTPNPEGRGAVPVGMRRTARFLAVLAGLLPAAGPLRACACRRGRSRTRSRRRYFRQRRPCRGAAPAAGLSASAGRSAGCPGHHRRRAAQDRRHLYGMGRRALSECRRRLDGRARHGVGPGLRRSNRRASGDDRTLDLDQHRHRFRPRAVPG